MKPHSGDELITQQVRDLFVAGRATAPDVRGLRWPSNELDTMCERFLRKRSAMPVPAALPFHTDLAAAFVDGQTFVGDDGQIIQTAVREVAHLVVTSGRLIACDPGYGSGRTAFERTIPKGRYPVILSVAQGSVVCAMVRIRNDEPIRWEMALTSGQKAAELKHDSYFGYSVDSGEGCFVDADQDKLLDGLSLESLIEKRSKPAPDAFQGHWGVKTLNSRSGGNLVAFHAGEGDGAYPSFWGLDKNGEVVCLVTDFLVLISHPTIEFFIPSIFSRPAGPVRHRALEIAGLTMEIVPGLTPRRSIVVGFVGRNAQSARVNFRTDKWEPAERGPSVLAAEKSFGDLMFDCREYGLDPKVADELRDRLGLHVRLPLNASQLTPVGVVTQP